jgi:hypothetical protein
MAPLDVEVTADTDDFDDDDFDELDAVVAPAPPEPPEPVPGFGPQPAYIAPSIPKPIRRMYAR